MRPIDILSFCLSILGIYSLLLYLRFLIPRYLIPPISALLNETQQFLLTHAQTIDAIPGGNELRMGLETLSNQLARMRLESNRSLGISQQVWLAIRQCLSFRLHVLSSRIESIRLRAEVAVDEEQVALLDAQPSADGTESAAPAADTATPMGVAAEPIPPPPAVIAS